MNCFNSPPMLFALLATIVALIFWIGRQPRFQWFFRYFPPLIWTYFVPMVLSSLGLLPHESPLYDFVMLTILPAVIVLLLVPSDTASICSRRPQGHRHDAHRHDRDRALCGPASFGLFLNLLPAGTLPHDAWRGIASLSGSWIGGSPNMAAIAASLGINNSSLFGKMVIVDTILRLHMAGRADCDGELANPDRSVQPRGLAAGRSTGRQAHRPTGRAISPITMGDFVTIIAVGFMVSQLCLLGGGLMAGWIQLAESAGGLMSSINLSQVLSAFGWGVLFTTLASVALSFTTLRRIEDVGASAIGNSGLYLLLTTFGAQADLRLIGPGDLWLIAIGATWLLVHITRAADRSQAAAGAALPDRDRVDGQRGRHGVVAGGCGGVSPEPRTRGPASGDSGRDHRHADRLARRRQDLCGHQRAMNDADRRCNAGQVPQAGVSLAEHISRRSSAYRREPGSSRLRGRCPDRGQFVHDGAMARA